MLFLGCCLKQFITCMILFTVTTSVVTLLRTRSIWTQLIFRTWQIQSICFSCQFPAQNIQSLQFGTVKPVTHGTRGLQMSPIDSCPDSCKFLLFLLFKFLQNVATCLSWFHECRGILNKFFYLIYLTYVWGLKVLQKKWVLNNTWIFLRIFDEFVMHALCSIVLSNC